MDDDIWGLGIGCNGVVDVLLEPLDDSHRPMLEFLDAGDAIASITVIESNVETVSVGDKGYVNRPETGGGISPHSDSALATRLPESVLNSVHELLVDGNAATTTFETDDGTITVFVDAIVPPPELVVIGTGNDVEPVVDLARRSGFDVTVVGFRGGKDIRSLFPAAHDGLTTSPASIRDSHDFDENSYVVIMTHNFVDDRLALDELLQTDVPYVGLLGPQKRFAEMLDEFEDEGRTFSAAEHDRIYTPIGLNLGGGTPYQIAQSIVSEVLAVHNGKQPDHLRELEGPIHDRVVLATDD
jgi:xanthine dehydrogenase accessory factor